MGFLGGLIDPVAVRRYVALVELHGFSGGVRADFFHFFIFYFLGFFRFFFSKTQKKTYLLSLYSYLSLQVYIQESDSSAAAVDALTRAVREHAPLFPLGFAYGGVSGIASASLARSGRGFASQGLVEELQARRVLSRKAARRVRNGEHVGASLTTCIALAHRLLRGTSGGGGSGGGLGMYSSSSTSGLVSFSHQTLLLRLMWDTWPPDRLGALVGALGGAPALISRFWAHYEATSPLTFLELGFNLNRTKDLIRLLRDRGVLAGLTCDEKVALARWLASPDLYGHGVTYVLMARGVRAGLHKFAKEGICSLLESCTQAEADAVMTVALGGRGKLMRMLRGNVPLSRSYARRVEDVERAHALSATALAVDGDVLPEAVAATEIALSTARRDLATNLPLYGRNGLLLASVVGGGREGAGAGVETAKKVRVFFFVRSFEFFFSFSFRSTSTLFSHPFFVSFFIVHLSTTTTTTTKNKQLLALSSYRGYAALPHRRRHFAPCPLDCPGVDPCHSREKTARVKTWRIVRKMLNALGCTAREAALFLATGGLWPLFVSLPRAAAPFFSTAVGLSAAVGSVTLLFLVVVGWALYHHLLV